MENFKVKDKVVVVNPNNTYTTHSDMFKEIGFNNTTLNREFQKGSIAEVFAIREHESNGLTLLALQTQDGSQCLISTLGVVKVVAENTSDQEFDIIRQFCDEVLSSHNISDRDIFKYLLRKSY